MPHCLICETDFEPVSWGSPHMTCECGKEYDRRAWREDQSQNTVADWQRLWKEHQDDQKLGTGEAR